MGIIMWTVIIVIIILVIFNWDKFSITKASRFDVVEKRLEHAMKLYKGRPSVDSERYDLEVLAEFLDIARDVKEGKI